MRTLVYVGAHVGAYLGDIASEYEQIFAFEPYPDSFNELIRRLGDCPWITFINAACSTEAGTHKFYVYPNMVSSSLAPIADGVPTDLIYDVIEVPTINLYDYLQSIDLQYIDCYISDCQGSDLNVLKTLKPYIDNRMIDTIVVETHNDKLNLYKGLDNRFQGFKDLLSENYEIETIRLGRLDGAEVLESEIPPDEYEWDTVWSLKHG